MTATKSVFVLLLVLLAMQLVLSASLVRKVRGIPTVEEVGRTVDELETYLKQVLAGIMWFDNPIIYNSVLITCMLAITIYWDKNYPLLKVPIQRAIADNFTHGTIGALSWALVVVNKMVLPITLQQIALEIILCGSIASLIDLDHFFAACSLSLKDVTRLKSRPPLHCSTFPLVASVLVLSVAYVLEKQWLFKLACIIFVAFASHHVRDATRRGLWFYPFGSTPPIPYYLYLAILVAIPYFILILMKFLHIRQRTLLNQSKILIL